MIVRHRRRLIAGIGKIRITLDITQLDIANRQRTLRFNIRVVLRILDGARYVLDNRLCFADFAVDYSQRLERLRISTPHLKQRLHNGGQNFRNTKVQQFWNTYRRNQNIRWFQIAVDYKMLVRVLNSGADGAKNQRLNFLTLIWNH